MSLLSRPYWYRDEALPWCTAGLAASRVEEKRPRRSSISKLSRRANCLGWLVWSHRRTFAGSSRLAGASGDVMVVKVVVEGLFGFRGVGL